MSAWKPTGGGNYSHPSGARVTRQVGARGGKGDFIVTHRGKSINLGRKATFPMLQAASQRLGVGVTRSKQAAPRGKAGSGKAG